MKHFITAIKITVLFSLCFCIAASTVVAVFAEDIEDSVDSAEESEYCNLPYEYYGSNKAGSLFVNEASGRFYFMDNANEKWYSNPDMGDMDQKASGVYRMELQSLLVISYYDVENNQLKKENSEAQCVRSGNVKISKIQNGFTAVYTFGVPGIEIPVNVELDDLGFNVYVDCTAIKENRSSQFLLTAITLLPYFGAGGADEDGYIVVADGSGSVMNFNNGRYTKTGYSSHIYGSDNSKYILAKGSDSYPVQFPVYGIKKQASSVTAIITQGDAYGTIWCFPNQSITSYSNVYTSFDLRATDTIVIGEDTVSAKSSDLYQTDSISPQKIAVSYRFTVSGDLGYNGMAAVYKKYLMEKYSLTKGSQNIDRVALDFYCAAQKKKSVLGFPVTVNSCVSSINDIYKYVKQLADCDITDVSVTLRSWSKNQLASKIDSDLKPVSCIGSKKNINDLSVLLTNQGGTLSLEAQLQSFSKSGSGFTTWFSASKSLSNAPIYIYDYYKSIYQKNKSISRTLLLKPALFEKAAIKVDKSFVYFKNTGISLGDFASTIYSDFSSKNSSALGNTKDSICDAMSVFQNKTISADFPPEYAFEYLSYAEKVPMTSSCDGIFDYDIPFAQLVMSGIVNYSCEDVNLSENEQKTILKAISYGSALSYSLITESADSVSDTVLNKLYYSNTEILSEKIKTNAEICKKINSYISDAYMLTCNVSSSGCISSYSNGIEIMTDYISGNIKVSDAGNLMFECTVKETQ